MKMWIEQGDPINMSLIDASWSNRVLLGVVLMCSIVLSNLFRNENITTITLPREDIPFDIFDSLESNNFKIYTRGTYGYAANLHEFDWVGINPLFRSVIRMIKPRGNYSQHYISPLFKSELYIYTIPSSFNWRELTFDNPKTTYYKLLQQRLQI